MAVKKSKEDYFLPAVLTVLGIAGAIGLRRSEVTIGDNSTRSFDSGLFSRYYSKADAERSATAAAKGISNKMPAGFEKNAQYLAQYVLDPISDVVGKLLINSWYRSQALNLAVGGVDDSDHRSAAAADIETSTGKNNGSIVAAVLENEIPFDQLIIYDSLEQPTRIHISYNRNVEPGSQKKEILVKQNGNYYPLRIEDAYNRYVL